MMAIKLSRVKAAAVLVCLALAVALSLPASAVALDTGKTVRVGWYDSSFNTVDQFGRRSGYAYDYQIKLSAYSGWTYEYVSGSWSELMEKLQAGEIDLMSDVSYTPEREQRMLFPDYVMGTEQYCLFISPKNQSVNPADYSTLNGKKVGANKGSVQADYFLDWARQQGVQVEFIELSCPEEQSLDMIDAGTLDAYVTVDSFIDPDRAIPVCKVGSSDYFFVVSKDRPDLLADLNNAMRRILDENPYFNQQMYEKHIKRAGANTFLPVEEVQWLSNHGPIKVGYQDNYLAFCSSDKATGELQGALKEYLDKASHSFKNAQFEYDAIPYPTAVAAMDALKQGEIDCVFPANLGSYDAETLGVVTTPSIISTDVYAMIRDVNQKSFASKEHVVVAVNEGNPNYDSFLRDNYPNWKAVYFPTTEDCLNAVAENVADCVLVSNYRYSNIARTCEKLHLVPFATGLDTDYSFAVSSGNMEMYSILTKAVGLIPNSATNSSMSRYAAEDARLTLADIIMDNIGFVMAAILIIILIISVLLVRSLRAEKKSKELISATEIDSLTGLYNRGYFFEYANRMYHENPKLPMDAIVLNIERFHSVNALKGWEFGDRVLRALSDEIQSFVDEVGGIAGRFQADRFDIYCRHIDDYEKLFNRLQNRINGLSSNSNIQLRMGVMQWQENLEPVQLFDHARIASKMARGNYASHIVVFDDHVREQEMLEQRLMSDLHRGLDAYEFKVYFQPKFDIHSEPAQLVGAEALVRWRHPDLGMLPPCDFIPLFEKSGQIGELDQYVWQEAAKQIARWREAHGVVVPISVNLSRVDEFDPALEDKLEGILRLYGIDHSALLLEVTESAYTENASQVIKVVESLRRAGFEVGMDDFGTGYSSLNMISEMPIDFLKMDSAFMQGVTHEEKDAQLVALIIGIADSLKIPVVAEGVESEEQINLLRSLGCKLVQGFYYSRPLTASAFESTYLIDAAPSNQATSLS